MTVPDGGSVKGERQAFQYALSGLFVVWRRKSAGIAFACGKFCPLNYARGIDTTTTISLVNKQYGCLVCNAFQMTVTLRPLKTSTEETAATVVPVRLAEEVYKVNFLWTTMGLLICSDTGLNKFSDWEYKQHRWFRYSGN